MNSLKICFVFLIALWLCIGSELSAGENKSYIEGEVLIQLRQQDYAVTDKEVRILKALDVNVIKHLKNNVYLVKLSKDDSVASATRRLNAYPEVEFAEPNYRRYITSVIPNDPLFDSQWAHENIQSGAAWEIQKGKESIIVALVDTGVDYAHKDLKDNIWINDEEDWRASGPGYNGIDDDGDGYIDNYFGINTITGSGDPMDDEGHGTHIAGIVGAEGNNLVGISGVNWRVSLMAIKFIRAIDGSGSIADEVEAIQFAKGKGAKILNMSFAGRYFSAIERDAIANAGGILFITSAGNERTDNDVMPSYPANYDLPNIISVAASNQFDELAYFSNYGENTVSLAAPGVSILSTLPGDDYDYISGTSMATGYVTGLAALILAKSPYTSMAKLKERILRTVDTNANLQGKILTGGRINAYRALTESTTGPYIYNISPDKGPVGSEVAIRGTNFRETAGHVLFEDNLEAPIISWTNEKIICQVPEGAVTGSIRVETSGGSSNELHFEVTPYPTMGRIAFPYIRVEPGRSSFIFFSNPLDHAVTVEAFAAGSSGDNTLKFMTIGPFGKIVMDVRGFGILNEPISLDCSSEEFFGAAILTI
ncbi:MAG: S8 family serine peptidase, partial [Desulfobacteraceae bacterium]|nr:S8 family serine peptidase [Desulfobacteraceae bacterium]